MYPHMKRGDMGAIDEISRTIKAVRRAKGLSQRALAESAGMPQSHISRIENAGVDLRLSSLTEIARALGLELTLVPRKNLPAVRSIVGGTQVGTPSMAVAARNSDIGNLNKLASEIARQPGSAKEAAQIKSLVHDLTRLAVTESSLGSMRNALDILDSARADPRRLKEALSSVRALRNALAHSPAEELRQASRPAYSLEDGDG